MQKLPESAEHDPVSRIPSRVCQILAVLSAGSFLVIFSDLSLLAMFSDVSFLAVFSDAPSIVQRRPEVKGDRQIILLTLKIGVRLSINNSAVPFSMSMPTVSEHSQ